MTNPAIKPDRSTITDATIKAYRDAAKRVWHDDGQIEIDDCAEISRSSDSGAYVQAWVWVYNDQLEPEPGPTYDVWTAEQEDLGPAPGGRVLGQWEWRFEQRFTCDDDPDGKGACRFAHDYARYLRDNYPCAFVAVRRGDKGLPLPIRLAP
jgi:hypothetical protein